MTLSLINLAYLASAVLFILALKGLSHPRTAVRGNLLGATGMLVAVVATFLYRDPAIAETPLQAFAYIAAAMVVGGVIGGLLATRIQMTAMPQMVALLNGFGGGASALVAGAALADVAGHAPTTTFLIATGVSGLIGGVTFSGSLIAFDKLQELFLPGKPIMMPAHQAVTAAVVLVGLASIYWIITGDADTRLWAYGALVLLALIGGVLLTIPIGGADMPVAIALLNSYSGLAAAATGFVLQNNALIITGSLVGASGLILTQIMCKAMNRSLMNVLTGGGTVSTPGAKADDVYAGKVKATSAEEIAMLFDGARRVVVVPGYGLAVSQAQHTVRDLANLLESRGTEVEFAIHPVAGRMPGHMNVLLAEADISYDKLKEMDEINPSFQETDVAIVIGANDVVNPLARTDPSSPIAGMPILDVDKARTVVVIKRSLSPGFAGIPNPLFAADNTLMYFADGKKAIMDLITAVKET
ncbi:MAG TPA: NAD(P)(+) transhydrogenase (Re/Si-specific) subunit beta [Vicinamibacterales bacterium]|nr:NAD(P)(+) transhydrogenase (Re/Si-specific) subunit beta [Vicinamibacterales bacterium]